MPSLPSLMIISHTPHYYNKDGNIVGWEPTIREINHLLSIFDTIYHIAPLYKSVPDKATITYTSSKIIFIPIKPTGGIGLFKKFGILFFMPYNLYKIIRMIRKVDWVHFRTPTNLGLYILPFLSIFKNKKRWIKYAGNWNQEHPPLSYRFQRWWLNNIQNSIVTINGKWVNQKSHLLSFENPCITEDELKHAGLVGKNKNYHNKLNVCFVGRLEPAKGVLIILDLVKKLEDVTFIDTFYIVGDGPSKNVLENQKSNLNIKVCLMGSLSRAQLNEIYTKCHLIILPSYASEGFPKVLAEAASYGCVPVVSNISSIGQYIENNISGIVIDDISANNLKLLLSKLSDNREKLINMASSASKWVSLFTYSRYVNRIETEIINA